MNEYQNKCLNTWGGDEKLIRAFFGVCGEAGELAECIKKHMRGDFNMEELKTRAANELGDTMYYIAVTAYELGLDLDEIGESNIAKLAKRYAEGKIRGDGDNR